MDVNQAAVSLVSYSIAHGLIEQEDKEWAYNTILGAVGAPGCMPDFSHSDDEADFQEILGVLVQTAKDNGVAPLAGDGDDGISSYIMGLLMPRPAAVSRKFHKLYVHSPKEATNYLYRLSGDVDYIRRAEVAKNIGWVTETKWGKLEITINLSKPEKDPRDIAKAAKVDPNSSYPSCKLCVENMGYAGRPADSPYGAHPARHNLRIVPIELGDEEWGFQFSPHPYFDEHCIAMSLHHRPMHIDRQCFNSLLDFVDQFPHYFIGSNADLPIVGGSILAHDHFQGGKHVFPIEEADTARSIHLPQFPDVQAAIVKWPMSVIRLSGKDRVQVAGAAEFILNIWKNYDDESVGIVSHTGSTRHNTITPIARKRDGIYQMDLMLRCNITSSEHPLGVFHPHEELHHIKKENIGLIECMGLAILPPRLKREIDAVERAMLSGASLDASDETKPHAEWARDVMASHPELDQQNIHQIMRDEIGQVFAKVLEDAGVFKWDDAGREAFDRFAKALW